MSTGGVYQTADGGESWNPANKGIKAYFFPDPWPEFGQCVHKVAAHPARPDRMYAQNHHGVYRSDDAGGSGPRSPTACRPTSASRSSSTRTTPTRCSSSRSSPTASGSRPAGGPGSGARPTPGETWTPSTDGLPDGFFAAVMRDAFTTDHADPAGLYFGARDGSVFASLDDGATWTEIVRHLPDVLSVRAAVV